MAKSKQEERKSTATRRSSKTRARRARVTTPSRRTVKRDVKKEIKKEAKQVERPLRVQGPTGRRAVGLRQHALLKGTQSSLLARAVALPMSYVARVPDPWDERELSVANPFNVFDDNFSAAGGGQEAQLAAGTSVYGISRDPLRHLLIPRRNSGGAWAYTLNFVSSIGTDHDLAPQARLDVGFQQNRINLRTLTLNHLSGPLAYGPKQYPALEDGFAWYWIDAKNYGGTTHNTAVNMALFDAASGGGVRPAVPFAQAEVWKYGSDTPEIDAFDATVATATINLKSSAFYRFSISSTEQIAANHFLEINVQGTADTFEFAPVPGFVERAAELSEVRVVGASLMVSPASTALAEGGTIVGVQIPEKECPMTYLSLTPEDTPEKTISLLLASNHSVSMSFKDGMFGWHKPTCEADMALYSPFVYNTDGSNLNTGFNKTGRNQVVGYRGHMFPPGGWMIIGAQAAPNPTTGTAYPGAIVKVTSAVSLNFDTESLWYHAATAPVECTLVDIRRTLDGIPQFTENPFHFSDITKWIKKNSGVLKDAAFTGLKTLTGAVAPEALPLVGAVEGLL